jgi:hypothetical protein
MLRQRQRVHYALWAALEDALSGAGIRGTHNLCATAWYKVTMRGSGCQATSPPQERAPSQATTKTLSQGTASACRGGPTLLTQSWPAEDRPEGRPVISAAARSGPVHCQKQRRKL